MRHTKSHTKNRRSHHALKSSNLMKCSNCSVPKKRHIVCADCGHYRGKKVVDITAKLEKKQARAKAKAIENE